MSVDPNRPLIRIEDAPDATDTPRGGATARIEAKPLIAVETLGTSDPVHPKPEVEATAEAPTRPDASRTRGGWLVWTVVVGTVLIALVGTLEWVLGLLVRMPLLGAPAALGAALLVTGLLGLVGREIAALRRLRDVRQIREEVPRADGDRLRALLIRIGADVGAMPIAQRAADAVEDHGPDAARRMLSREALAPRDRTAALMVGSAARQGFVMVTASPSPAFDSALLVVRAARLLREIATVYGYRPSALALRSLALAATRDAGAVAVANALAEAAAEATSRSLAKGGDAVVGIGSAITAGSGTAGAVVGVPLAVVGVAMSLFGRTVGAAGGAVGGGATAAWRLYRFGLMVLVAARPLPFDGNEMTELSREARREVMRLSQRQDLADEAALSRSG